MSDRESRVRVIVVMGVSGVGKTTVGLALADRLEWEFYDADDFHPATNVRKMHRGVALNDQDRRPWLHALRELVGKCVELDMPAVLACSALKESYRKMLHVGDDRVAFVYLAATPELVQERLKMRSGHFMNPELMSSQFETLEVPKDACHVNAAGTPAEIVDDIREALGV